MIPARADVVILGSGIAAQTAAETLRRYAPEMSIVMISREPGAALLDATTRDVIAFYKKMGYHAVDIQGNPPDYIGQMCHFADENRDYFNENTLTLGDFNINMLWNNAFKKEHNYERFLEIMSALKQESLYHKLYNCTQGEEKIPTSYYRRNPERPFHIDYIFGGENVFTQLKKFKIHGKEWLTYSDHLPLELEI